jgi:hypothetical protein
MAAQHCRDYIYHMTIHRAYWPGEISLSWHSTGATPTPRNFIAFANTNLPLLYEKQCASTVDNLDGEQWYFIISREATQNIIYYSVIQTRSHYSIITLTLGDKEITLLISSIGLITDTTIIKYAYQQSLKNHAEPRLTRHTSDRRRGP